MELIDRLERFRRTVTACGRVAFVDPSAGMVLAAATADTPRREVLDALGRQAVAALGPEAVARLRPITGAEAVVEAIHTDDVRANLFLASYADPSSALACVFADLSALLDARAAAVDLLATLTEETG